MNEVGGALLLIHGAHETWAHADAARRRIGLELFLMLVYLGAHGLSVRRKGVLKRLHKIGRRRKVFILQKKVHGNPAPILDLIEGEEDNWDEFNQASEVVEEPHQPIRVDALINLASGAKGYRAGFLKFRQRRAE